MYLNVSHPTAYFGIIHPFLLFCVSFTYFKSRVTNNLYNIFKNDIIILKIC